MRNYFAPLEGICTPTFRKVHRNLFNNCDGYYAPFITISENERITSRTLKDILPDNNKGQKLYIQLLTDKSGLFCEFAKKIKALGYNEVNLNFGCPSATVVGKGRGSGILRDTDKLDEFLDAIFASSNIKISVKTRIGYSSPDEFEALMRIYNRYPIERLIIHPRTRNELYSGRVHTEVFDYAYSESKNPLCYNGDIVTKEDYGAIAEKYPKLESIMIGRGAVQNPAIFREINGGKRLCREDVLNFLTALKDEYSQKYRCDTFTLHKLKEVCIYLLYNHPDDKKLHKAVKKAQKPDGIMKAMEAFGEI